MKNGRRAIPPPTQRRFNNVWGELAYLCDKIRFWLYARGRRDRAERFRARLASVLESLPDNDRAIIKHEGLALLAELVGSPGASIPHRLREIELMEELQKEANSPRYSPKTRAYLLRERGEIELRDRRAILDALQKAKLHKW
jgi:hypothetical protein